MEELVSLSPNKPSSLLTNRKCSLDINQNYNQGDCLLTNEAQEKRAFFQLPQTTSSSWCVYNTPIRYLINTGRVFCPIKIDPVSPIKIASALKFLLLFYLVSKI
jgi:hypothetical protein